MEGSEEEKVQKINGFYPGRDTDVFPGLQLPFQCLLNAP